MRYQSLASAAALAVLLGGGCVNRAAQQQAKKTQELVTNPTRPVTLAAVQLQAVAEQVNITGELTTSEDVTVGAKNPGRIISVYVKDGDFVRKGDLIAVQDTTSANIQLQQALATASGAQSNLAQAIANARLAPSKSAAALRASQAQLRSARALLQKAQNGARAEERTQASANVAAAKSSMETAKKDVDRKRDLFASGAISRAALDTSENAYQSAMAQYQSALASQSITQNATRPEDIIAAQEAVRLAEDNVSSAQANKSLDVLLLDQVRTAKASVEAAQSQVRLARQAIQDAQIRAPFSGRISGNPVQAGSVPGAGNPIAHIISSGGIYFEGDVPETMIGKVRPGSAVNVTVDAVPGRVYSAHLISVGASASSVARLFSARVQLDSPGADLKPGMFARGVVTLRVIPNAVVVPTSAIVTRNEKKYVFTLQGAKAHKVEVNVGLSQNGMTQVTGVQPGDKVVTKGQSDLEEGTPTTIDANPVGQTASKGVEVRGS